MCKTYTSAIAIAVTLCFLLISCGSPPRKVPEGNIDVDSDIYIVPMESFLFSIESGFRADLDSGNISRISQQFRNREIEFSNSISIDKKADEWLIWDSRNRRKYSVKEENGRINVYSYVHEELLYPLIPRLEKRFTTKVHLALDKRMSVPDYAYDYGRQQYAAIYILTELNKVELPRDAKILGVTNVDLFVPESDLPFIFGQAHFSKDGRLAVISTLRMDPSSYKGGKPDDELLVQRMMKEAVHELGHVFGLRNSADTGCVMYLPRNLKELDRKSDSFCLASQKAFRALKQPKTLSPENDGV